MKYFFDTEFHEYHKQQTFLGFKIGKKTPTIDLISIGIVTDDNRTFYEISKDFNIKDAWNSYQLEDDYDVNGDLVKNIKRVYWLRINVLKPIFNELSKKESNGLIINKNTKFNLNNFKRLIKKFGKTNSEIAKDIAGNYNPLSFIKRKGQIGFDGTDIKFYAYYGSYDWVVLAQLFGKMIDLPRGFPMFAYDLKQMINIKAFDIINGLCFGDTEKQKNNMINRSIEAQLKVLKNDKNYPKQKNEHNALDDAKWNKKLYKFLQNI